MSEKEPLWVQALSAQVKAEARATAAEAENARLHEALEWAANYDPALIAEVYARAALQENRNVG